MSDLGVELDVATSIAADAADVALSFLHRGVEWVEKNPRDLVSEADRAVERLIVARLGRAFPDDDVVGEEGTAGTVGVATAGRRRWYVDPIDGTTNYLKGLPAWGVSLGLADPDDELLVGVIVLPVTAEVFTAVRGGGARRNGVPIRVSDPATLDRTVITYALAPRTPDQWGADLHPRLRTLMAQALGTRMQGCSVADLTSVAMGRIDATVAGGMSPWDVAAGLLLVAEAGGRITAPDGTPVTGPASAFVAGSPSVHPAILSVLTGGPATA